MIRPGAMKAPNGTPSTLPRAADGDHEHHHVEQRGHDRRGQGLQPHLPEPPHLADVEGAQAVPVDAAVGARRGRQDDVGDAACLAWRLMCAPRRRAAAQPAASSGCTPDQDIDSCGQFDWRLLWFLSGCLRYLVGRRSRGRGQGHNILRRDPWGRARREHAGGEGHGLDRREGRDPQEALAGRPVGQPDRQAAGRGHPQRGDRQGAPAGPLRPRRAVASEPARPSRRHGRRGRSRCRRRARGRSSRAPTTLPAVRSDALRASSRAPPRC